MYSTPHLVSDTFPPLQVGPGGGATIYIYIYIYTLKSCTLLCLRTFCMWAQTVVRLKALMRVLRTGWILTRPLCLVPLLYHTVYTKRIVVESTLHQRLLTKEVVSTIMLSLPLLVWNHCWLNCWSPTAKAWLFYFCCNPQKVLASNQDCCWGQSPLDAPSCWALVDTLSNGRPFHVFILLFLCRLILSHVDHPVPVDLNQALLYHFCGLHHFQPCWKSWVSSDSLRILCWSGTHVDVVLPAVLHQGCFCICG